MWENITSSTKGAATVEIIIMLLVAFILGYLLRYFLRSKSNDHELQAEIDRLRLSNSQLKSDLDACMKRKVTAPVAAAAAAVPLAAMARPANPDDLKKIEGIGPKIEQIMNGGGVWTWAAMADSTPEFLNGLILAEWPNNKVHDAGTWPEQAALARDGKWDELKKWQDELKGGK